MALRYDPDAFEHVPPSEYQKLTRKCEWLWTNRQTLSHTALRHDLNPFLRRPVGAYRIIYTYDNDQDEMVIRLIAHRNVVYKRASRLDV